MNKAVPHTKQLQSQRIADLLDEQIKQGVLQNGERLASENELANIFGVARGTMRNALEILKSRSLITTKPGVGSFVAYHGVNLETSEGWTAASAQSDIPTHTELLDVSVVPCPQNIEHFYHPDTSNTDYPHSYYRILRRRLANDTPVSIEISYLPRNTILDSIMKHGLLDDSISLTMKAAHLIPTQGKQDIVVDCVPDKYRSSLNASPEDRYLIIHRYSLDKDNTIVEYVVSYLHPDHFSLHLEFGSHCNDQ